MKTRCLGIVAIAAISFCAGSVLGHHATSSIFDLEKLSTLKGMITKVNWSNPHMHVFMDVTTCKVDNWAVELGSLSTMYRAGLVRSTLQPGMDISFLMAPALRNDPLGPPEVAERAKARHYALGGCLTLPNGTKIDYPDGPRCPKSDP